MGKSPRRLRLFSILAAGALVPAGSAHAAGEASQATVPELVVTAQFRSENVQRTPIAITALSAARLEQKGAADIAEAANLAPNVSLTKSALGFGQMASIFIRGVGQSDPHFAVEPGVGMYVDDVYYGVLPGAVFQLLDVDRVEVLRGPQGTLAGKNSLGGAIKLFSKRPGPDSDAYVQAGYGSLNLISGKAAGGFTLVPDKLFGRIAIAGERRDGYFDRLDYQCATGEVPIGVPATTQRLVKDCKLGTQGGVEFLAARASLKWTPTEKIADTLMLDIDEDRSENPPSKLIYAPQSSVFGTTWTTGNNYFTCPTCYSNYETNFSIPRQPGATGPINFPNDSPLSARGAANNLAVDLSGNLKLESITGYRWSRVHFFNMVDGTPASVNDQSWRLTHGQWTEELRLSGEVGKLAEWTLGGFYYHADGVSEGRVVIPFGITPGGGGGGIVAPDDILFRDPVTTESKSVFAHLVIHPIDRLTLTLGGRYTDDSKTFTFLRYDPLTGLPAPEFLYNVTVRYAGTHWDYRVNLDYQWSDEFMTYAQVSTGYRGGGVNPRPFFPSQAVPYQPETITAYEVGFKSELFGRKMMLNAAGFFNDYKNFQAVLLRCDSVSPFPGAPCAQNTNVGDAHVKGLEADVQIRPVGGLQIDASAGLLDFTYTRVNPDSGITLGMTNVYTPKFTAAAGVQYAFEIGGDGTLTPRIDYSYRSKIQTLFVNDPLGEIGALGLFNARLTWEDARRDWQAALSVTNLADKFYYQSKQVLTSPVYNVGTGTPGLPREVEVTIRRRF
jgi:iron complex outermembrane receptor protein